MSRVFLRLSLAIVSLCATPSSVTLAQRTGGASVNLPDGTGKEIVQAVCARCHGLGLVVNNGYTHQEWRQVFGTMVDLPNDQTELVATYLATHFPDKPKPAPVVIQGSTSVRFKEWPLPTKGSRPHDPLATPDGALWYTGMFANNLGRVDTKTGQIKEFALKTEASGPHGLTADKAGKSWFTANSKGYIGKLDPKTGDVTEYPLPAGTGDPHTPIFDQKGTLWFTAQGANRVGRLDPRTGEADAVSLPAPRSKPNAIDMTPHAGPI